MSPERKLIQSYQELLNVWIGRHREACARILELERENQELRDALSPDGPESDAVREVPELPTTGAEDQG